MRAAFPMYDLPEIRSVTDAWWAGLAAILREEGETEVPESLCRDIESLEEIWLLPDLLISQTCGYPLTHRLKNQVTYVATPAFDAPGCDGSDYRSAVIVRADDERTGIAQFSGARAAFNNHDSQSGMNAFRSLVAPLAGGQPFFSEVIMSGSHAGSMEAVASGRADIAAVDCITYALIAKHRPASVGKLRILGYTAPAPGLPFITRTDATPEQVGRLRRALQRAASDPALAKERETLLIGGVEVRPEEDYDRIVAMRAEAEALGYGEIR